MSGTRLVWFVVMGIIVAVCLPLTLNAINAGSRLSPQPIHAVTSTFSSAAPTPTPDDSADSGLSEREVSQLLVQQLQKQCSALSPVFADPSNWSFTTGETGHLPFEMMINLVDDRTIFLYATPYPSGEVKITPFVASAALAYSVFTDMGCSPAPGAPKASGSSSSGSTDSGATGTVTMPDFHGQTEIDVTAWFDRNAPKIAVEYDYGSDSNPDCEASGDGDVIGQSPAAGSNFANSASTHVLVDIDCSF
jgi:hypothetical protein